MLVRYDCETGADEATVLTTDPDDFDFQDIEIGTGAEFKHDTAKGGARGSSAVRFATTGTSAVARAEIAFTGNLLYAVTYFNPGASWSSTAELIRQVTSLGGRMVAVRVNASREVLLVNAAGTNVASSTALTADVWHRIELHADIAAGTATVRIYSGADLHTNTESQTLGPITSGYGTVGTSTYVAFGQGTGGVNVGPGWIDEFGVSDEGWMGAAIDPTAPPPAPSTTIKSNLFENTLTDGTVLTPANSGYPMNDALSEVTGAVSMQTRAVGGSRYIQIAAEASTGVDKIAGVAWDIEGNDAVLDARILTVWPKSSFAIYEVVAKKGRPLCRIIVRPDGSLQIRDRHNTVLANQPTTKVPNGDWVRLRLRTFIHATTPASNLLRLAIFAPVDATTATETINNNGADIGVPGRSVRQARIGVLSPSKVAHTIDVDAMAVSDAGPPAAPTFTSLSHATRAIGESVQVVGDNYLGAVGVKATGQTQPYINAVFTLEDDEHISVVIPEGAITGPLVIQTVGGEVSTSSLTVQGAGPAEDIEFTDVTPGTGLNENNTAAYELGNAIPEMTFEQDFLYEMTLGCYEATGSAEVPVPDTPGLTWEPFGPTIQVGAHAVKSYRCRPSAAVTSVTNVRFSAGHERLMWLVGKYNKFDGSLANGASAIGVVSDVQSVTTAETTATFGVTGFTAARKNLLVAVALINVAEAITAVAPAEGSGQVIATQTPTRTLKKVRRIDSPTLSMTYTTPATYRGYAFEVVSGSSTGTGGGGGGGGGGGWTPPVPNTDPNPAHDTSLTNPTLTQINDALAALPSTGVLRILGDFAIGGDIRPKSGQTIVGPSDGSKTQITVNATRALSLNARGIEGLTISDIHFIGGNNSDTGITCWLDLLVRRCEFSEWFVKGAGGSMNESINGCRITFDTCFVHDNGRGQFLAEAGHSSGGIKVLGTGICGTPIGKGFNLINSEVRNNFGVGMWFDHCCGGDRVESNYIHHNTASGIRFELTAGPSRARGNRCAHNGFSNDGLGVGGVADDINASSAATIYIIDNDLSRCTEHNARAAQQAIDLTESDTRTEINCPSKSRFGVGYFFDDVQVLGNVLDGGVASYQPVSGARQLLENVTADWLTYDPTPV